MVAGKRRGQGPDNTLSEHAHNDLDPSQKALSLKGLSSATDQVLSHWPLEDGLNPNCSSNCILLGFLGMGKKGALLGVV